ncbi:hypothetical protein [Streptomyces microflavus]|uniref:hypothetical protein n=1 Tax=Streptomyces microflavus TaxID=1919 RepID=UPI00368D7B5E
MEHIVRDAAGPFGRALAALSNTREYRGRARDIAISYNRHGAVAVFADRTTEEQREQMTNALTAAFADVGWGVTHWGYGPGLNLSHPTCTTRIDHPSPDEAPAAARALPG